MGQTWKDLLFAHWRVPPDTMREHVPPELSVDVFDGDAWIGVTPFEVTGLRLIAMPPIPRVSTFLELNVRTYVTAAGKPGILFFSLDAASALAVQAARRYYRLPYFRARMSAERAGTSIEYSSERLRSAPGQFVFKGRYGPTGGVFQARPGSLEYFLTERYCLYTVEDGQLFRGEIHHPPWPLQPGEAKIDVNTMAPLGIEASGEPLLHFARRQDVVIWSLRAA
jgi:uncharacterized protein YqjF (DUF2071 family)